MCRTDGLDKLSFLNSLSTITLVKMDKKPLEDDAFPAAREPYVQPELKELGQVGALTQAGTTTPAEMGDGSPGDDKKVLL